MNINEVVKQFDFSGELVSVKEFGSGHINNTYLAEFRSKTYVVQKINSSVFKNPYALMENIFAVTDYLSARISESGGNAERKTLHFIKTKNGEKLFKSGEGEYYRAYVFVENSVSFNNPETPELFKRSGQAFGSFQNMLAGFDATKLYETIPNFHNTPWRYENEFLPAVRNAPKEIKAECEKEILFLQKRKDKLGKIQALIENGSIPLRVTHNDTKLNNVLFDKETGESLAVIDLDTVMPGSALFDFGDAIRYGTNSARDEKTDLSGVCFKPDYFKAYAEGWLGEVGEALNDCEKKHLAYSAWLMTAECGMRFLTDYLNGSVYFKTSYPKQNLLRARNQLKLAEDMELHMAEMEQITKSTSP